MFVIGMEGIFEEKESKNMQSRKMGRKWFPVGLKKIFGRSCGEDSDIKVDYFPPIV